MNNMKTTLHVNELKFHKLGKWRNNKNGFEDWLIQCGIWIAVCCFAFKTKLINLFSPPKNTNEFKF